MSRIETINPDQILACFDQAIEQTFETYFFMEALPVATPPLWEPASESLAVELIFKGPFSGHLHVLLSMETALALVGTLALPIEDLNNGMVSDLFAEITNTIGGRIAAALAGDDFAFDLTIPEVTFAPTNNSSKVSVARHYQTDYGSIVVSVSHLTEHRHQMTKGA